MDAYEEAGINAIIRIDADPSKAFVPSLSDYIEPSPGWTETEYRCLSIASTRTTVGYWTGEPGAVSFESWPYTEVCSILAGKVAIEDKFEKRVEFSSGDGFIVPKGFMGRWITLEPSTKIFMAIE